MTQTYLIAITDGGSMPIDIKINLTFKEALKEVLSHLENQDITKPRSEEDPPILIGG